MTFRSLPRLAAVAFAAALAACGGSSSSSSLAPVPSPSPSASPNGTTFVALGDDATVGIGTTVCGGLPSTACPSSPAQAGTPLTVNGAAVNGYAQTFAQHVSVLHAGQAFLPAILGVSGALAGNEPVPGATVNDLLDNSAQAPALPGIASSVVARRDRFVIVVFAGINDVVDAYFTQQCGGGTLTGAGGSIAAPCGAHGTTLPASTTAPATGSLFTAYRALFTSIKTAAPTALVVVGIPDVSKFPAFAGVAQPLTLNSDTQLANAALKAAADGSGLKYAYADVYGAALISPAFYTGAFAADGFHFSETGYSRIEGLVEQAFTAAYPSF